MIGKITGIAVCFVMIITQAAAQEFGIELNGGLQGMHYTLQSGETKQLPGGSLGVNYTFRLGGGLGLLTGVSGGIYRTQAKLRDGLVFSSGQVDDAGSAFEYNLKLTGYKETQQFYAAGVPLLLQFRTGGEGLQWYIDAGGKVFIPFNTSIKQSAQQLVLSGYYPDYNLEIANLPQHGFGTVKNWNGNAGIDLKPAAVLSAATGICFGLSPGTRLYAGVFVDYGLTDLKKKQDSLPFAAYSSGGIKAVQTNSVLNMQNTGTAKLLSFGVQVRISFGSAKAKSAPEPVESKEPRNPADSVLSDFNAELIERPVVFGLLGETAIPNIQKEHLDEVAEILLQYPDIRISIVGHICNSETETENPRVGALRARTVAAYLHSKGVSHSRMKVNSLKESDEIIPENPEANYRNRKAEIRIE